MKFNKLTRSKITRLLSICISILLLQNLDAYGNHRTSERLNFDWKFTLGDVTEAKNPDFDDSQWEVINVPHDASIYGEFDPNSHHENGFRPRHIGWYRKILVLPEEISGKDISIEFEGVYRDAEVWINGIYLGRKLNGYASFTYDVTQYVSPGENIISVRYDNTFISSRWYSGEGIYRDVWLHITNPIKVAENGTYITTPFITDELAKLEIQTELINNSDSESLITLQTVVYSPTGKEVESMTSVVPVPAKEEYVFRQSGKIENPILWDINSPNKYSVKSYVLSDGEPIDEYNSSFGVRTVEFTPTEGFLLNGRKVFLKGVNLHHDLGPLGSAYYEKGMRRRLEGLKEMGVNAIRLAHNPHAKSVLDLCDEMGILIFDECFDQWDKPIFNHYGPDISFDDHWREDLAWFLKRDRNHPCVFIWSIGNEVYGFNVEDFVVEYVVPMQKKMVDFVHKMEPTRKVTMGLFPARGEDPAPTAFHMDVVSDNYMSHLYDHDHKKFPQLILLQSETATRNGGEDFFIYDHSYTCGQFYWGGTDYIGESIEWPNKLWNGIIDLCDFWKPLSYFIQSIYSDKDMVKIAVYDAGYDDGRVWNNVYLNSQKMSCSWNWEKGLKMNLFTFTTGEEVELFLNDRSLGVKQLADYANRKIPWEVEYEPGTLKAVSRRNGEVIAIDEIQTAGKPYKIELTVDSDNVNADGMDLAYVTVKVLDKNGVVVPYADNLIKFDVQGPGVIAAVGNGDIQTDELFVSDRRSAYEGKCLLIVRSLREAGQIKISASSKGIKSDNLVLRSSNSIK